MAMGRPKKLTEERKTFTIYLGDSNRKAMDEYVYQRQRETKGYSRSDFLNEAVEYYLKAIKRKEKSQKT